MRYDDLRAFHHVAIQGSFTGAARVLRRPKSSVSAAVARLEATLGLRLLERTTRRIRLTEAGGELHHQCAEHVDALNEVLLSIQSRSRGISGTLRLAAPYEFGAHHLAATAARLMSLHPELQIVLDVEHRPVDLFDRNYDIVFSMTDRELSASSVVAKRVFTLERGVFAAPSLLRGGAAPCSPDALAGLPLLCGVNEEHWSFIAPEPEAERIRMKIAAPRLVSPNAGVRKLAALAGVGVVRITKTFCASELKSGELIQLLADHTCQPLTVYALMPARRLTLPRVRLFLNTLAAIESA
ncbi:LysR family transcriptional regulator [Pikeienuella piscinae]|uniref:LysR family transcriptional regulator n=1 Tax=Pikeienuella piscinae TaxID=2748098 RepID=A0A7L5BSZ3_9RHOB|nr:LysR family transcriptional regulator [Pikeienuella piscinae]QIE54900.1 LysR family transcriptional regulator [Pikeienuella piscinae]